MGDSAEIMENFEAAVGKEKFEGYKKILNRYFKGKISKVEMDQQVMELLSEHISYHNQFFISLGFERKSSLSTYFESEDTLRMAVTCSKSHKKDIQEPEELRYNQERNFTLCTYTGYFPDFEMLGARTNIFIFSNSKYRFKGASVNCVKYLTLSIRVLMKSILMKIFASRGECVQRGNFSFSFGVKNEFTLNELEKTEYLYDDDIATSISSMGEIMPKVQPHYKWKKAHAAMKVARQNRDSLFKHPINLFELYNVLLTYPEILPFSDAYTRISDKCLTALINLNDAR